MLRLLVYARRQVAVLRFAAGARGAEGWGAPAPGAPPASHPAPGPWVSGAVRRLQPRCLPPRPRPPGPPRSGAPAGCAPRAGGTGREPAPRRPRAPAAASIRTRTDLFLFLTHRFRKHILKVLLPDLGELSKYYRAPVKGPADIPSFRGSLWVERFSLFGLVKSNFPGRSPYLSFIGFYQRRLKIHKSISRCLPLSWVLDCYFMSIHDIKEATLLVLVQGCVFLSLKFLGICPALLCMHSMFV